MNLAPASVVVTAQSGALTQRTTISLTVQFPAELADVGDARREHHDPADLDLLAAAEPEPGVRHVVGRHRGQHVPGPRSPQPDRRPGRGEVRSEEHTSELSHLGISYAV